MSIFLKSSVGIIQATGGISMRLVVKRPEQGKILKRSEGAVLIKEIRTEASTSEVWEGTENELIRFPGK